MKTATLGAVLALFLGGLVGCGSSDDHRDVRESGGPTTTRGGERDDSTRMQSDPVCGMTVNPRTAIKESYNGQSYYFDTRECAKKFRDNPQAYLTPEGQPRQVR